MRYKESYLKSKVKEINSKSKCRYFINWDYNRPQLVIKEPNSTGQAEVSYRLSRTEMGYVLDSISKYLDKESNEYIHVSTCCHVSDNSPHKSLVYDGKCISCSKEVEKPECINCLKSGQMYFDYHEIKRQDPTLTDDTFNLWICRNCNFQPFTSISGLI